jgi:hypothetical protein
MAEFVSLFDDEEHAASQALAQSGASNCGETAVLTCFRALALAPAPTGSVVVRARDHSSSLSRYLRARAVAGCMADDLVAGAHSLGGARVQAAFVPCGPAPPTGLGPFLARAIRAGMAACVTVNLQPDGCDYWHHQPVMALRDDGPSPSVLLGNPVEWMPERDLARLLGSASVLLVRADDVLARCPPAAEEMDALRAESAWERMGVAEQVQALMDARARGDPGPAHIAIPASYVPGVTLIAPFASQAAMRALETLRAEGGPWRAGAGAVAG